MNIPSTIIRNIIAPLWAKYERTPYLKVCRYLQSRERISRNERRAEQWVKLQAIIRHASIYCPYYKRKFKEVGFHPGDLKSWEDFERLPILTKDDIRENKKDLLPDYENPTNLTPRKTSGSTGVSLDFYVKESEMQYKRGVVLYRDQWTAWRPGDWKAMVWGNPEYLNHWKTRTRNALLDRMFSLDTLKMKEGMMVKFAQQILKKKPTLLFGHAHSLYLFADFWKISNYPSYPFKAIISTAMVLHDYERALCEDVFQTRVFNRYGCEEVSLIASECESHQGLHVNTDSLIVQVEGTEGSGNYGALIITDLVNKVMPFIRYQVGDMASSSNILCSCGRTYPILDKINGRVADYLVTPEREWVSGISLTENFATLIPGLKQIQIIQDRLDHLRLRIVSEDQFDGSDEGVISKLIRERFGPRMSFSLEEVPRIEPEISGKYRFSIKTFE
jgi:phenylacetate-CoA ligase